MGDNYRSDLSAIHKRHIDFVLKKLSPCIVRQHASTVIRLYMGYLADAVAHGYKINITRDASFCISKISVKDLYKYPGWKFKSDLTSDWLFFIDFENSSIRRNKIRYVPTTEIIRKANAVIRSVKVYELIR